MTHTKCLIIGSGPSGYTAAIYAQRAALDPILMLGNQPGGQLMITTDVENFPGFPQIQGPALMEHMKDQCEKLGVTMVSDNIKSLDLASMSAIGDTTGNYKADTIIIATGAQAKWLGLESESHFQGHGVSGCATCDAFFYKNKIVCVVGGGNTAVEEAIYLTKFASKVYLIHRRDSLRADQTNQKHLFNNPKVEVLWHKEIVEIRGENTPFRKVNNVELRDTVDGQISELDINGVFIAIGHSPATSLVVGQLKTDSEGYIIVAPHSTKTSAPGVFAAGDVQDKTFRQAVTAAGQGCMAALEAERYLQNKE